MGHEGAGRERASHVEIEVPDVCMHWLCQHTPIFIDKTQEPPFSLTRHATQPAVYRVSFQSTALVSTRIDCLPHHAISSKSQVLATTFRTISLLQQRSWGLTSVVWTACSIGRILALI